MHEFRTNAIYSHFVVDENDDLIHIDHFLKKFLISESSIKQNIDNQMKTF